MASASRPSRVPSVPVLFDNESKDYDNEAAEPREKQNLPEILFEPLHVLDPLCIKWKLSKLSVPVYVPVAEEPEPQPEPPPRQASRRVSSPASSGMAPVPTSAKLVQGYVRFMGLCSNGSPWDCNIPVADLARERGVTIGRDASYCDIVLAEGSVSRRHVLLGITDGGTVLITDLQTTNGTFINGRRLMPHEQRVPLEDGSILTLGDITLRVEILPAATTSYIPL